MESSITNDTCDATTLCGLTNFGNITLSVPGAQLRTDKLECMVYVQQSVYGSDDVDYELDKILCSKIT